ncbi:hypothetical protein SO802_017654 [Lithocarpus litseifolius]|uniref:Uncharacterized protein n=1 Tax=Lithocarpus litseifolius TaxID=425828 RepID=A0AAW2CKA2_9ROSI
MSAKVQCMSAKVRAESVYYPPAICGLRTSGSKADTATKDANEGKENPTKVLPTANIPPKEAEQSEVVEKAADSTKEVANDANLPPATPKDPSKEKEASHNIEILLETLLIPTKEDLKGNAQASSMVAFT